LVALLRKFISIPQLELMEMTYLDVERYVLFYVELENEKKIELIKIFSRQNAESTSISISSVLSKNGRSLLKKYLNSIERLWSKNKEEEEQGESIEDQFENQTWQTQ